MENSENNGLHVLLQGLDIMEALEKKRAQYLSAAEVIAKEHTENHGLNVLLQGIEVLEALERKRAQYLAAAEEELIASYGYPLESYEVQTEDGYLLTVHRIPHGKNSSQKGTKSVPVFLMHGLLCSSADWVLTGPDYGLAFILADRGYDVWLGNVRGNVNSRKHISISPENGEFWQYSWNEIGLYDLPVMIDLVLEKTNNKKLFYIGHSQGSTSFLVLMSCRPEYNDKIMLMSALAPVAFMKNVPNPVLQVIAQFGGSIEWITKFLGINEFMPSSELFPMVGQLLCKDEAITQELCSNILFLIAGFDSDQLNRTTIPMIMDFTPAGSSTKQILHYVQEVSSGKFRKYDFGKKENIKLYGTAEPPDYDLSKVSAPIALYYGNNDFMAAVEDVDTLYRQLKRVVLKLKLKHDKFNHLDFLWGKDVVEMLYNDVIDLMERYI